MAGGGVPASAGAQRSIRVTIALVPEGQVGQNAGHRPAGLHAARQLRSLSLPVRARSRSSWARFSATYDRSAAMGSSFAVIGMLTAHCDPGRGARVKGRSVAAPARFMLHTRERWTFSPRTPPGIPRSPLSSKASASGAGPSSSPGATGSGHGLIGLGLPPGGHVIVYAENSLEHYLAGAAARAAGLIPAPMNHRLVAEEALYILDHSDAVAVLVSDRFLPIVEAIRAEAKKVRQWILLGAERRPWGVHVDDLLAAGRPDPVEPRGGEGFGASIIYTGGTTGKPKGALRRGIESPRPDGHARGHGPARPGPRAPGGRARSTTRRRAGFALYTHLVGGTVVVMPKFDPGAGAGRRSSGTAAPAPSWRRRCSSASWTCPRRCARATTCPRCARSSWRRRRARCA